MVKIEMCSPEPDFGKTLEEQDALFDMERDVPIETQTVGIESMVQREETIPEETYETESIPNEEAESSLPVIEMPELPKTEELSAQQFYEDLEIKDSVFDDRMSDQPESGSVL